MKQVLLITISLLSFLLLDAQINPAKSNPSNINNFSSEKRTVNPQLQEANAKIGITEFEDVFSIFDNAVAQNPNSAEALLSRARYKYSIGMVTEANADIKLAKKINPYLVDLYGFNGAGGLLNLISFNPEQDLIKLSKEEKIEGYSRFLTKSFKKKYLSNSMREVLMPIIEIMYQGKFEEALAKVDKLAETEVGNPVIYDLRGFLLRNIGDDDAAMDAFILATSIKPKFYISWYNLAVSERKIGMYEECKTHLDKTIEIQSEFAPAYLERASYYKKMGKYEEAIKDYTKVIVLKEEYYAEAYLNRGLTKMATGDYNGAVADLSTIINQFPDNEQLRLNRGNLNLILGNYDEAYKDLTSAIALNSEYEDAYFTRGLTSMLMYNVQVGCHDLVKSQNLGHEKVNEMLPYFCNN